MRRGSRFALDLGSVRIGVAKCDPEAILASPFAVWPAEGDWIHGQLVVAVEQWQPIEIVVGNPINLAGAESSAAAAARQIARVIAKSLPLIPIRLVDERMTTAAARKQLQAAGHTTRTDRALIDAAAATVLLEDALQSERLRGNPPGEVIDV